MKAVVRDLKLRLAQFVELESFSQFSSDLDPQTQAQLERGRRLREILKQRAYCPLGVGDQISVLHAGIGGFLDWVDLPDIPLTVSFFLSGLAVFFPAFVPSISLGSGPLVKKYLSFLESYLRFFQRNVSESKDWSGKQDQLVPTNSAKDYAEGRLDIYSRKLDEIQELVKAYAFAILADAFVGSKTCGILTKVIKTLNISALPMCFRHSINVEIPDSYRASSSPTATASVYKIPALALFIKWKGCFLEAATRNSSDLQWACDPVYFFCIKRNPLVSKCVAEKYTMLNSRSFFS
jgi:hypothetical protein